MENNKENKNQKQDQNKEQISVEYFLEAVSKSWHAIVEKYIDQGGDINIIDPYGKTPLINAINNEDWVSVKMLLDNGADVNFVDDCYKQTALMRLMETDEDYNYNVTEEMVEKCITEKTLNKKDRFGYTPLERAILANNPRNVEILLDHGANCKYENKEGFTPMMIALIHGNIECARKLLEHGIPLELPPKDWNWDWDVYSD